MWNIREKKVIEFDSSSWLSSKMGDPWEEKVWEMGVQSSALESI